MTEVSKIKEKLKLVIQNKGKVILSGTHCCGKTTMCKKYLPYFATFPEMTRELESSTNSVFSFRPGETTEEMDAYIFSEIQLLNWYMNMAYNIDIVTRHKPALLDRCVFDPIFYIKLSNYMMNFQLTIPTRFGVTPIQKETSLLMFAKDTINNTIHSNFFNNSIIFLPMPLPLDVKDEFRLKGEEIQAQVFENAKAEYKSFEIPAYVLHASVIDKMLEEVLEELGIIK